jgi:hypothetical protein
MPRLPDDPVQDEEHGTFEAFEDYRHRAWDGAYSFWQSFLDFALRDNVLEVAVGLMCVPLPSPPIAAPSASCRCYPLICSDSFCVPIHHKLRLLRRY